MAPTLAAMNTAAMEIEYWNAIEYRGGKLLARLPIMIGAATTRAGSRRGKNAAGDRI